MSRALKDRGYRIFGQSRQFRVQDFDDFDLILAMDHENLTNIIALARSKEDEEKVKLFCEFCTEHSEEEVPDPYYGGDQGFDTVADLIEDGTVGILRKLNP